jgi:hypothetical protein
MAVFEAYIIVIYLDWSFLWNDSGWHPTPCDAE